MAEEPKSRIVKQIALKDSKQGICWRLLSKKILTYFVMGRMGLTSCLAVRNTTRVEFSRGQY